MESNSGAVKSSRRDRRRGAPDAGPEASTDEPESGARVVRVDEPSHQLQQSEPRVGPAVGHGSSPWSTFDRLLERLRDWLN